MAKLGSIEHPAVVRVRTYEKAAEMMKTCKEHGWQVIVGIEPDKREDISDVTRLLNSPKTTEKNEQKTKTGRNDQCPCGSGLKYKNCCLKKEDKR
jgi:SWIM/SEC-C metal-binding protein